MAIKTRGGKYKCGYCGIEYAKDQEADTCKQSHKLIYIALTAEDLNRLHNFIYFKSEDLFTDSLLKQIKKAVRSAAISQ